MQIHIDFYKKSGKWYAGGDIEIPDTSNIFDENILDVIDKAQRIVINPRQFIYVVDNITSNYFFKGILNLKVQKC